ncbi:PorP/SprF family type IX secretion system membrane protein [Lewinella sp. W8]|uniref:PorP/SprF family type IX secretion system membrane protein n=1 Tax=Lewinella sp. W8 TaxID=2528208 RepID=UPI0010684CF1|nr:PorP/SprF family type IX secretion system membrane protein [Lewinella sp. W8]MTB50814.1 type IX secretion system membrane protein PorP/SprF [Lewinella sp. W8]
MKYTRLLGLGMLLALMSAGALSAQQLSLFTQYRENATLLNPAAMESDFLAFGYNMSFGANYRRQWAGQENTPETQSIRFSYINPYRSGATLTAGAYLLNDQTGPTGYTGFYGRIGTVLGADPESGGISIGLSAGYVGFRVRSSELVVRDDGDPLTGVDQSQSHPDIGVGIYAYQFLNDDNLIYGGISVPQLLGFDLTFQNDNGEFNVQRLRHYYGTAGWYYFTGQDSYLELSTWIKYVEGAPLNADLTVRYQLPNAPYLGAGISSSGIFHFEAGINVGQSYNAESNFRVGYAYDYSFSSFGPSVGGTHEIQLAVALNR